MWQRVVHRPLILRLEGGLRMKCYPHSHAAALVLYCRLPEWEHMCFVCDFIRPGDTFVDVGANVGTYSLLAAAIPDVRIVAFEPSTLASRRLQENVDLNGLRARVEVLARRSRGKVGASPDVDGPGCDQPRSDA